MTSSSSSPLKVCNGHYGLNIPDKKVKHLACKNLWVECELVCSESNADSNAKVIAKKFVPNAEIKIENLLLQKNLTVNNIEFENPAQAFQITDQYFALGQYGQSGAILAYNTPKYMSIDRFTHYLADSGLAFHFIMPFPIKELRTDMEMQNATGPVGDLSITIANAVSGESYAGTIYFAALGSSTDATAQTARHILTESLPANTPFLLRFQQTGDETSTAAYRFVHKVKIAAAAVVV